jgi:putative DNA primase/helicase
VIERLTLDDFNSIPDLTDITTESRVNGRALQADPGEFTDLGNAQLLAKMSAARLRHVPERREWFEWHEGRWRKDDRGAIDEVAKDVARERLRQAAEYTSDQDRANAAKWAIASHGDQRIQAMIRLARTEPGLVLRANEFDADPFLLACGNGTLDLRTGELRPHQPFDLISLGTDVRYDPEALYPRWLRFLLEVFDGDEQLIQWVRRFVGYCLTGEVREHVVAIAHGFGCNGKDTFMRPIHRVLGDHARTCGFDTFMRRREAGVRNDLAALHRSRLVIASESNEDKRLDEALIKLLSGGGNVTARFLYGEFFEYEPQFKILLVTNHRPRVDGNDDAIWRRLRLIPFEVSFQGREDRTLAEALESELPGILNWAVQGCLEWQQDGLGICTAVERATNDYRADEDVLAAFIAERCVLDESIEPLALREAYDAFCKELGEKPVSANALGKRLAKHGITRGTANGAKVYRGISLRP